jgi:hypothetical protein
MGTKANPGKYDCYANAAPDEPMFVLLGRDKHAPTLVWLWAVLRELDQENPDKIKEAKQCVLDMIEWKVKHGGKVSGLGESVLAGVLELIRSANIGLSEAKNNPTGIELVQKILGLTKFDTEHTGA